MKPIRKVLFPSKFEDLSFRCVERLLPLKAAGLEEVVFLFVIDREEVGFDLFRGFDKVLANQMREAARLHFEDWEKALAKQGLKARHLVEIGSPEGKILQVSCSEEVDLIVTGRQRHVAADAVYLGGTSMGVLRRTAIPVLVCKHPHPEAASEAPEASVYERVLYATDFSEDSLCGLEFLKRLRGVTARVDVVHAMTEKDLRREERVLAEEAECRQRLDAICSELRSLGMEAESHLLAGAIAEEVLEAATDHHATLILMGTKGKHGVKEIWLGSASHRVAESSPLPVLLVPRERAECYI
ncbi:MAG: universal stress protein [Proteobacteria bacterium]|nr:universal stress protein [Pseudomonadota bacterium]